MRLQQCVKLAAVSVIAVVVVVAAQFALFLSTNPFFTHPLLQERIRQGWYHRNLQQDTFISPTAVAVAVAVTASTMPVQKGSTCGTNAKQQNSTLLHCHIIRMSRH